MFENNIVQISSGKLLGTALLPSSALLAGGIIIWRIWRNKQLRLQAKTDELSDQLNEIKQRLAGLQAKDRTSDSESPMHPYPAKSSQKSNNSPENTGLFEYLIEDNIRIRQQSF